MASDKHSSSNSDKDNESENSDDSKIQSIFQSRKSSIASTHSKNQIRHSLVTNNKNKLIDEKKVRHSVNIASYQTNN